MIVPVADHRRTSPQHTHTFARALIMLQRHRALTRRESPSIAVGSRIWMPAALEDAARVDSPSHLKNWITEPMVRTLAALGIARIDGDAVYITPQGQALQAPASEGT